MALAYDYYSTTCNSIMKCCRMTDQIYYNLIIIQVSAIVQLKNCCQTDNKRPTPREKRLVQSVDISNVTSMYNILLLTMSKLLSGESIQRDSLGKPSEKSEKGALNWKHGVLIGHKEYRLDSPTELPNQCTDKREGLLFIIIIKPCPDRALEIIDPRDMGCHHKSLLFTWFGMNQVKIEV